MLCTVATATAWVAFRSTGSTIASVGFLAGMAACCYAALSQIRACAFHLMWTGTHWFLGDATEADSLAQGSVQRMLDLDQFVLLRWQGVDAKAGRWLALQRNAMEAWQWHALRCAIYAPLSDDRARAPAAVGAGP